MSVLKLKQFFQRHWDQKSPVLLGYSGGPDSKALLYLVREIKGIDLHVAHVDHGWRKESAEEAALLEEEVKSLSHVFHTTRLQMVAKNKEAAAREERMAFFLSLFKRYPFQALLLGHQADDLAETALKRIFEGAHLPFLGGMKEVTQWEGIWIWRPLLKVRKDELVAYLEKRKLPFFEDATNRDPLYLRSRMRMELLPLLRRSFGKEIGGNLTLLSERTYELKEYLEKKVAPCPVEEGEWGIAICCQGLERMERRFLLQTRGRSLPRSLLEKVLDHLEEGGSKKFLFKQETIWIKKGWVFFLQGESQDKEAMNSLCLRYSLLST